MYCDESVSYYMLNSIISYSSIMKTKKLDMIKTPVVGLPPPGLAPAAPVDPRARAGVPPPVSQPPPSMAMPSDPRARAADPRAAVRDPRAAAAAPNFPPPPNFAQPPPSVPPPQMQQQQPPAGVAGLDPNLVQQVMALTPQQIALLPPDKQQSILALRQQITGGR